MTNEQIVTNLNRAMLGLQSRAKDGRGLTQEEAAIYDALGAIRDWFKNS